jgi:hypothetical protein
MTMLGRLSCALAGEGAAPKIAEIAAAVAADAKSSRQFIVLSLVNLRTAVKRWIQPPSLRFVAPSTTRRAPLDFQTLEKT